MSGPRSLRTRLLIGATIWSALLMIGTTALINLYVRFHGQPRGAHWVMLMAGSVIFLVTGLWILSRGLLPFEQLRQQLGAVRDGKTTRLDGEHPTEVQPLVDDLNALLDHRDQAIRRAQTTAGDLAHGLKTPLAVLTQEIDRAKAAGHVELAATLKQQIDRMRRQVDYHLAHARASASGATPGTRTHVWTAVDALARTVRQLYADKQLTIDLTLPQEHFVRVQREDLDEMLGNLIDNACKWARGKVAVSSSVINTNIEISVEDDGPGVAESMREVVLQRGVRADEAAPGSGLGLAIVRDLADLYGGSIVLVTSPLGGLRAKLTLPAP
jgi:signal transduction histidine kinase